MYTLTAMYITSMYITLRCTVCVVKMYTEDKGKTVNDKGDMLKQGNESDSDTNTIYNETTRLLEDSSDRSSNWSLYPNTSDSSGTRDQQSEKLDSFYTPGSKLSFLEES